MKFELSKADRILICDALYMEKVNSTNDSNDSNVSRCIRLIKRLEVL